MPSACIEPFGQEQLVVGRLTLHVHRYIQPHAARIGDDRGQRHGRLLEGFGLLRAEAPHAHVGVVGEVFPVRFHLGFRRWGPMDLVSPSKSSSVSRGGSHFSTDMIQLFRGSSAGPQAVLAPSLGAEIATTSNPS